MLINYFKLAISSIFSNKTYSAIVFFGITFTFIIIIILTSIYAQLFGNVYPESKNGKPLYLTEVIEKNTKTGYTKIGGASLSFSENLKKNMKTPKMISIISKGKSINFYVNEKKIPTIIKFTDANFWKSTSFKFKKGRPYNESDFQANSKVIIITDKFEKSYFGGENGLGKKIKMVGIEYKVIGIVKSASSFKEILYSNIYIPNLDNKNNTFNSLVGDYRCIFIVDSNNKLPILKQEYFDIINTKNNISNNKLEVLSNLDTVLESYTRNLFGNTYNNGLTKFYPILALAIIIFLFLPAINLINLILARTSERNIEIAVRKSFGASSKQILSQFIFENIVINIIGLLISIILSLIIIKILDFLFFENINLSINGFVLFVILIISLFFAIITGLIPARKLSKINPIEILQNN